MTNFDREMQRALMLDAQKLRDLGADCPDPIFLDDDGVIIDPPAFVWCSRCGAVMEPHGMVAVSPERPTECVECAVGSPLVRG